MKKIKQFMKESWLEFKKVRWPSKSELWGLTLAVITASILLSIFVGFIDSIFYRLVHIMLP
ncbi:preprotein translocase subunit SecE [bacterium]|nr:preprotein translocase subunit SecE [bacterium]